MVFVGGPQFQLAAVIHENMDSLGPFADVTIPSLCECFFHGGNLYGRSEKVNN